MTMKAVSLRSLKSLGLSEQVKSAVSSSDDDSFGNEDFNKFVVESCKKFQCPILVIVSKEILRAPLHLKSGKSRVDEKPSKRKSALHAPVDSGSDSVTEMNPYAEEAMLVTAVYDPSYELVEVLMVKYTANIIPRVLMKVIALKVPFTKHLAKFTIRQCRIDMYTVYELNKILTISNITDICLDQSSLKEGNYDILLSNETKLRNLSLSRCYINDIVCERIASRLTYLEPAEPTLMTLNLSSNNITDVGMKYLGQALRSNRHLRYLNLSDNHISDVGASYIFEVLTQFCLTVEESVDRNRCYIKYLKKKEVLYNHFLEKIEEDCKKSVKKGLIVKNKFVLKRDKVIPPAYRNSSNLSTVTEDNISKKARAMVLGVLGPFMHPYGPSVVYLKEGLTYCIGNFTLCYLNLRYNNLTFNSVQRLVNIVNHQKRYRNEKLDGLTNILLEGNYLPAECEEYMMIINNLSKSSKHSIKKNIDKITPVTR